MNLKTDRPKKIPHDSLPTSSLGILPEKKQKVCYRNCCKYRYSLKKYETKQLQSSYLFLNCDLQLSRTQAKFHSKLLVAVACYFAELIETSLCAIR